MKTEQLSLFDQPSENTAIRAITLWQPYATLIALGLKQYETRSWATKYRGKLIIHSAARKWHPRELHAVFDKLPYELSQKLLYSTTYPMACCVAVVDLTRCLEMINGWVETNRLPTQTIIQAQTYEERCFGNWQEGRYAWKLSGVQQLQELTPAKGKQGLWIPDIELVQEIQQRGIIL